MNSTNPLQRCRWHTFASIEALEQDALKRILAAAAQAIGERGAFHLVLAGGRTPQKVYRRLVIAQTDWSAWHIYFGDERCVPLTDSKRNSAMAAEAWLAHVPIPRTQIHVIPAELGARKAADVYSEMLNAVEDFDLVLLGLGEDGHTASLFPDHDWGSAQHSANALAVFNAPKPPPERVSLSAARLSRARQVLFMVSGESKQQALAQWRAGHNIPAGAITPESGVDVLLT